MLSAVVVIAVLSQLVSLNVQDELIWHVEDVSIEEMEPGLYRISAPGFSYAEDGSVLLPEKTVMIPVPPGEDFSVSVVPAGVQSLGKTPVIAASEVDEDGYESFVPADLTRIQPGWGEVAGSGTFRRAGYVAVNLRPVVIQNGELLSATSLQVNIDFNRSSRTETVSGHEGEIFRSVFGTNQVWRTPLSYRAESPFWGKPWAKIQVDTAGVFEITGEFIPQAVGMPSASFSMITGRGRTMSYSDPASDAFVPLQVPIFIDDGGDGIFDNSDRIIFYGRGLSWWGEFQSDHYNSLYDSLNVYWLTWGGAGGPFMDQLDGSNTGAPSAGTSYVNRLHFEKNQTLAVENHLSRVDDLFAWDRIASSSSTTAYFNFSSPGTTGQGTIRVNLTVHAGSKLLFTATVNGAVMADTIVALSEVLFWDFPVTGLKNSGNSFALKIENLAATQDVFVVYTNWFEVFPETGFRSWSTQCQVPLDGVFPSGERRSISWAQNLSEESFVCMVLNDTSVVKINVPTGKTFEVDMPEDWREPVMWVVPGGDFKTPVSITSSAPGRIQSVLSSGSTVYIYPDEFANDMPLFVRGRSQEEVQFLSLTEIYDEFNGGVRDPSAIRAFMDYAMNHWSKAPDQLVLVGNGHFDPRGFTTTKPCFIDIIIYTFYGSLPVCSDYIYTVLEDYGLPQAAVSRIAVDSRTELQLVAQRSAEYSDPSQESGIWQSVILGAADDERSPKYPNSDELYHTMDVENIFVNHIQNRFIPERHYLIEYDWNSNWKKPEARQDYINTWQQGSLISFFLGHGGFDQIADEGLLFIEDVDLLACGPRLPYAFFGSCDVGVFQNPNYSCIAQKITVSSSGGAIVASGASTYSVGSQNAKYLIKILNRLLSKSEFSIGECQWLGLLDGNFNDNDKPYIVFGDGSLDLALPDSGFALSPLDLLTSEPSAVEGSLDRQGLVLLTAWESAVPDSYYTHNHSYLLEYLSTPGIFYRGLVEALPDFSTEIFVPSFARTGDLGRVRYFSPGSGGGSLACAYPESINPGVSSGDEDGPEIELWLSGFRGIEHPSVTGDITFEAALEDVSGINLLPFPGAQLALYIDDSPVDVSDYFTYEIGSSTSGRIVYPLPALQPGDHLLRLRASDNVTNISWAEMTFTLSESSSPGIDQFFVYPTPASTVVSFNWVQSMEAPVSISIYSISGRLVKMLGNLPGRNGYNQQYWNLLDEDGSAVSSGSYIYVVSSGDSEETGVLTIVR